LEEEIEIVADYKPGPQDRFLIDRMAGSIKALSKLMSQLESIKKKVDDNSAGLGKVREKVNLAMASISVVQRASSSRVVVEVGSTAIRSSWRCGHHWGRTFVVLDCFSGHETSSSLAVGLGQDTSCQLGDKQPTSFSQFCFGDQSWGG
jgi:hypothetical protein